METGLNPEAIRRELDTEEWEEDGFNDSMVRRTFLGTVFVLVPSGKYYEPFACSNLSLCSVCHGNRFIGAHRSRRVRNRARARHNKVERLALKRYNRGSPGVIKTYKIRNKAQQIWHGRPCPHCEAIGSREAYLDEVWKEEVEEQLRDIGASLEHGEGDPCDLFAVEYKEMEDDDEQAQDDFEIGGQV
jgi:hypothetical protein